MKIKFTDISPQDIEKYFPEFYSPEKVFFEISKDSDPVGFYAIKDIGNDVGEISVYINEQDRNKITKELALRCLNFPLSLGFKKILVSTEVKSIERFLKKLSKFNVKYLFKNEDLHWFEVNYEL